jgi:hypothetical protein
VREIPQISRYVVPDFILNVCSLFSFFFSIVFLFCRSGAPRRAPRGGAANGAARGGRVQGGAGPKRAPKATSQEDLDKELESEICTTNTQ